ncbi:MAG: Germinal-center associated nuclear protein, partial [Paramarteilia canceri]
MCEKMCPDNEFVTRKRLGTFSIYETDEETNDFDPHLAVKDYHRSSAGEQLPTELDLRTESALKNSILFILDKVVDSNRGSLDEWYDFIWSRSRAIRKEIAQQQLFGTELAFNILEVVTRFHIIAQVRLEYIDEAEHYDQKLNSENLSACFTDLIRMYEKSPSKNLSVNHLNMLFLILFFQISQDIPYEFTYKKIYFATKFSKIGHEFSEK